MSTITQIYDLDFLVARFNDKFKEFTGGSVSGKTKAFIKAPEFVQTNNKRICIKNFTDVATSINRTPNELSNYINKELHVTTTILPNDGSLIIYGSYKRNQIESIIKKFVAEYVQCPSCKTQDTRIDKIDRINYIICNKCFAKTAI